MKVKLLVFGQSALRRGGNQLQYLCYLAAYHTISWVIKHFLNLQDSPYYRATLHWKHLIMVYESLPIRHFSTRRSTRVQRVFGFPLRKSKIVTERGPTVKERRPNCNLNLNFNKVPSSKRDQTPWPENVEYFYVLCLVQTRNVLCKLDHSPGKARADSKGS